MHPTNQSTLNGRLTKQQIVQYQFKIGLWIFNKIGKVKKKEGYSKRGVQITYGQIARTFKISYKQARSIVNYLVKTGFFKRWQGPISGDKLWKNCGNFYQWQKRV